MSYKAIDVARHIVSVCARDNHPISNLQLQKILYFAQREYLQFGSELFEDEIEAWQFGPVVPEVYWKFSVFGASPIRFEYEDKIDSDDSNIIDYIAMKKRDLNPWDLVEETHEPGMAWDTVYKKGRGIYDIIPKDMIRDIG